MIEKYYKIKIYSSGTYGIEGPKEQEEKRERIHEEKINITDEQFKKFVCNQTQMKFVSSSF